MADRTSIQRFRVLEELGSGAVGTVYRAHDPQLDRDVAIKVLRAADEMERSELSSVNTVDLRANGAGPSTCGLLHEARMMARLSHPNVVPIYEVGLDGASVFFVMEHVAGADLRHWLATPRPSDEILRVFAQAGRGLAAAHDHGIVHRDFKPDNVMIGIDGRPRVSDFGLSSVAQPTGLVRSNAQGGTPRYMAPELWNGDPATPKSDVFAFCVSLAEALGVDARDEGVVAALRQRVVRPLAELVIDGLSDTPDERPALDAVIAALERRPIRVRTISAVALGLAGLATLVGGAALVLAKQDGERTGCEVAPSLLAGRWDAHARQRLRAIKRDDPSTIERVVGRFDARATALASQHRAICTARRASQLTEEQAGQREACIERRVLELGAIVDVAIAETLSPANAEQQLNRQPLPASCETLEVSPRASRAALDALYVTFAAARKLQGDAVVPTLTKLEHDATAAGDRELAARVLVLLASRLRDADQMTESLEAAQRGHRIATEIRATDTIVNTLLERASTLTESGNANEARSVTELALEGIDHPLVTTRTRMSLYHVAGRGHGVRGDLRAAISALSAGLGVANGDDAQNLDVEISIRIALTDAQVVLAERGAITFARETVEFTRRHGGVRSHPYALALLILGKAHVVNHQTAEAIPFFREGVAVLEAIHTTEHSQTFLARGQLGSALLDAGQFDAAHAELSLATAAAERNAGPGKRVSPWLLSRLGMATYAIGKYDEGIRRHRQAIALMASTLGNDHRDTLAQRFDHVDLLLDQHRLDEAARLIDELKQAYLRTSSPNDRRRVYLDGTLAAQLALDRGHPRISETLARESLAALAELGAGPEVTAFAKRRLGESLVAQGRFADALPILEETRDAMREAGLRADVVAFAELSIARAELGLGRRAEALARTQAIETLVARYPNQPLLREGVVELRALL